MSLPSDSRMLLWLASVVADPCDPVEAVDKQRDRPEASGAPRARLGDKVGEGDSHRSVGVDTPGVLAMAEFMLNV
jgi:hypothetical protein